jgi:hypothetical protein
LKDKFRRENKEDGKMGRLPIEERTLLGQRIVLMYSCYNKNINPKPSNKRQRQLIQMHLHHVYILIKT